MPRLITLTTDFGTRDAYVATMKGVILNIAPEVVLVDVTHEIRQGDVMEAAFTLRRTLPFFPHDAIHLVVVDPTVGTERRGVAVRRGSTHFVGPDNGLFPLVLDEEKPDDMVSLDAPDFWRVRVPSSTFHGRDIFAPAAAHLAGGVPIETLGTRLDALTPLHWALPIADDQGVRGWVVHVDHFGNCITNITREVIDASRTGRRLKCYAGSAILDDIANTYGSVAEGEPVALFGSNGHLEIAVNGGNAADLLGIRKGAPVNLVYLP